MVLTLGALAPQTPAEHRRGFFICELLLRLHDFGVKWIEIGGKRVEIETLVDELRGSHPKAGNVAGKLNGANPLFVWCDGFSRTKAPLSAPPTPAADIFPTGSAGVCP